MSVEPPMGSSEPAARGLCGAAQATGADAHGVGGPKVSAEPAGVLTRSADVLRLTARLGRRSGAARALSRAARASRGAPVRARRTKTNLCAARK